MKASGATSMMSPVHVALDLLGLHHVVEAVEERAEVGIDLGDDIAGEEAELFAGLDGGADQDDAA